jgi:hypothetical protein
MGCALDDVLLVDHGVWGDQHQAIFLGVGCHTDIDIPNIASSQIAKEGRWVIFLVIDHPATSAPTWSLYGGISDIFKTTTNKGVTRSFLMKIALHRVG